MKQETSSYRIARLVSDVANPLFIPPLVFILLGWLMNIPTIEISLVTGLALVFYTLLPLSFTIYLLKTGHIESMDLPRRTSRNRLYSYSIASYALGSLFISGLFYFYKPFLAMIGIVFLLNPLFGYLLNLRWKLSMHSASIAAAGTIFFVFFSFITHYYTASAGILSLCLLLLLLPLMIWARHYLDVHSTAELLGGTGAGIILTMLELSIMLKIW